MKYFFFSFLFFASIIFANEANNLYSFNSLEQENRFYSIIKEIGCPLCSGSSIDGSGAPIAKDMKNLIHQMILENKSNQEIKLFLTNKFGEDILFMPPTDKISIYLFIFPLLVVGIAIYLLFTLKKDVK